jgi:hypothetical protein
MDSMNKKRWIWIGCGGCLGVVILGALVSIALGTMGYRYVKNVEKNMDAWETQMKTINQAYPFTPPGDNQIQADRYTAFLNIREKTIAAAEKRLDWLFQFMQSPERPSGFAVVGLGFNFLNFFANLSEIGAEMADEMTQEKMSMKEYVYLTRSTMSALYQWSLNPENAERKAVWDQYMKAINDLTDKIERFNREKPGSNVGMGPLNRDQIMSLMKSLPSPPPETQEVIFTQCSRINSSTAALFVDDFIVQHD